MIERESAMPVESGEVLLDVRNLKTYFPVTGGILRRRIGWVKAVDDVSFSVRHGETLGLVGESGCGKTTTGRSIVRLVKPRSGRLTFDGKDLLALSRDQMKHARKDLQIIFQDPYSSLNPRMSVGEILGEGLLIHGMTKQQERDAVVRQVLSVVGLRPEYARRYPFEFSGGQRQRIGIARALALRPKFVVCDEPVSALDVSIQSQVLNLLKDLQAQFGLTYLFIAHDLSVVEYMSDRVGVMYLGKLVELADAQELYANPRMPYTQALLSAIPAMGAAKGKRKERVVLQGDVPSPLNPPSGCPFRTRCWKAQAVCAEVEPAFREVSPGHWAACHFATEG